MSWADILHRQKYGVSKERLDQLTSGREETEYEKFVREQKERLAKLKAENPLKLPE